MSCFGVLFQDTEVNNMNPMFIPPSSRVMLFFHPVKKRRTDQMLDRTVKTADILTRLSKGNILLAEGAMGTEMQGHGLEQGDCGEEWNVTKPDLVLEIHRAYVDVGADLIYTNTFGATELRLREHREKGRLEDLRRWDVDPDNLRDVTRLINVRATGIAREAIGDRNCFVAGDLGPTAGDKLITGAFQEETVSACYYEQGLFLKEAGVDLFVIETVFDPQESGLAYRAVQSLGLPILVSAAITRRNRQGDPATDFGLLVNQLPELYPEADVLGVNCGQDIDLTLEAIQQLSRCTDKPILAKPNAGVPEVVGRKVVYSLTPRDLADYTLRFVEAGANIVGGCCGTRPHHIAAMKAALMERGYSLNS